MTSESTTDHEMDVDSERDWESEFQTHFHTFENLIILIEELIENIEHSNKNNHSLLYRIAHRIIIDLGTDFEHLSEMVIVFWMISNLEKTQLIIDEIDKFYHKINNLCNSLQMHYFENTNTNDFNQLSLMQMNEFLTIER
eukprot:421896_1